MPHDTVYQETCLFSRKITYFFMLTMIMGFVLLNFLPTRLSTPSFSRVEPKYFKKPSLTLTSNGYILFVFFPEETSLNLLIQRQETLNADDDFFLGAQPVYFNNSQFSLEFTSLSEFKIIRSLTSETLFELEVPMIFEESHFNFTVKLPTNEIFGLDEAFFYKSQNRKRYTLFDNHLSSDPKKSQSHFPMYLVKEKSGFYHLGYMDSIAIQEIELVEENLLSWNLKDHSFNFHLIVGDKYPENTLKTFRKRFGTWKPPKLWGLGFFQARELYTYIELIELARQHKTLRIPLEAFITNISPEDDCKMPFIHKYMHSIQPFLDGKDVKLLPLVSSPKEFNSVFGMQSSIYDCKRKEPICGDTVTMIPKPLLNKASKFVGVVFSEDYHQTDEKYNFDILQDSYKKLDRIFQSEFFITRTSISHSIVSSSHWITNLDFSWDSLRETIRRVLNYNIFGIPFVGGDICGSFLGTSENNNIELCLRWYQMAGFLPFMINSYKNIEEERTFKELPNLSEDLQKTIKRLLNTRYGLAQQIHTYFLLSPGETIIKPLSFLYPDDPMFGTYGSLPNEEQFIIGDTLMVSPCLFQGRERIEARLPENTTWFDLRTFSMYNNTRANVSASLTEVAPYFITEGKIVFRQETEELLLGRLSALFDIIISFPSLLKIDLDKPYEVQGHIAYSVNQTELTNPALQSYLTKLRAVISINGTEKSFNISLIFSCGKFPIQFQKIVLLSEDPKFARYGDVKSSNFKKSEMKSLGSSHSIKLEVPLQIAENKKQYEFTFRKISI